MSMNRHKNNGKKQCNYARIGKYFPKYLDSIEYYVWQIQIEFNTQNLLKNFAQNAKANCEAAT